MPSSRSGQRVLVTGHQGYIGSVLTPMLASRGYRVFGLDAGFFAADAWADADTHVEASLDMDLRDLDLEALREISPDQIIHLAGLSNDPLGEFDPSLTEEINFSATVRLAEVARELGVKRFVYFSSQSMYGVSDTTSPLSEDAPKNPVTAYADTKWRAEQELLAMSNDNFVVTALRPSTVYGPSPRFRSDIIMNNMTALALETGRVVMRTDGTPWRPIVHVDDICRAAILALEAEGQDVSGQAFNVGYPNGNFTVRDIGQAVAEAANVELVAEVTEEDPRSYQVAFDRFLSSIGRSMAEARDLGSDARTLNTYLASKRALGHALLGPGPIRLLRLRQLVEEGHLTSDLRWSRTAEGRLFT